MLFKNKNARAVLVTALAVITIIMLTLSVYAEGCGEDTSGCYDTDGDGYCDWCGSDGVLNTTPPAQPDVHVCNYVLAKRVEPSCDSYGYEWYVCSDEDCDEGYTKQIDLLEHDWFEGVCQVCGSSCEHFFDYDVVYPTCESSGVRTGICDYCNSMSVEELPAKGHKYTVTSTTNPTCTEAGVKTSQCTNCGVTKSETNGNALGHTYANGVCSNCGGTCTNHTYIVTSTTNPTCTEAGVKNSKCSICQATKSEPNGDALGHSMNNGICGTCGYTDENYCDHKATEMPNGIQNCNMHKVKCSKCGPLDYLRDHVFNADGVCACGYDRVNDITYHSFVFKKTVDPTCIAQGYKLYECKVCHFTKTEKTSDALGHSFSNGVCTSCGVTNTCQHLGESTVLRQEDSRCHISKCALCSDEFNEGHTYVNGVCACGYKGVCWNDIHAFPEDPQIYVAPTDHQEGYYQKQCQRCGAYSEKTPISPNHMTQKGVSPASCEKDGYITYKCMEGCGYEATETIPALGGTCIGTWNAGLVNGCERYYSRTCTVCGASGTKVEYVHTFDGDSTKCICGQKTCNHDWNGKNVLSLPTCTTYGVTEYWCLSCQNNGYITDKIERADPLGHGDTYWKSTGNDSCGEYCGRCNMKLNVMNHFGSSDPATPCVKEYSSTSIVFTHYCERCGWYATTEDRTEILANVLVVIVDEHNGRTQRFDYDSFKTYKYIFIENRTDKLVSSMTFEVASAKNMALRYNAILNHYIPAGDNILIDIENEIVYSHEKKHRVDTVTLNGNEGWKMYQNVYRADNIKNFDKYWKMGAFPEMSVLSVELDSSVHGDILVAGQYIKDDPALMFLFGETAQPLRLRNYSGDFGAFIENLKKSPIVIKLEHDERVVINQSCTNSQFIRAIKTDHEGYFGSGSYEQGYNDAIQSVINENPVQGFFQGIWSSMVLFFTILGSGITIGGIALSSVFYTIALLVIVSFAVRLLR